MSGANSCCFYNNRNRLRINSLTVSLSARYSRLDRGSPFGGHVPSARGYRQPRGGASITALAEMPIEGAEMQSEHPDFRKFTDKLVRLLEEHGELSELENLASIYLLVCGVGKGTTPAEQLYWITRVYDPERHRTISYKEFLKGPYWRILRKYILSVRGSRCALCGADDEHANVHHRSYEHHGREHEYLDDLIVLCRDCHSKFHNKLPITEGLR